MTKPEIIGSRDLKFSGWLRDKLPNSSKPGGIYGKEPNFWITDVDFTIWHIIRRRIMMLEVKIYNAEIPNWQLDLLNNIDNFLRTGIEHQEVPVWKYEGFHKIRFENTFFDDGRVYLDDKEISEAGLIDFLSMKA